MTSWWVYILECEDGSFYIGSTANLLRRIISHSRGTGAKYTRAKRPISLAYCRKVENRRMAQRYEARLKRFTRAQKEALIKHTVVLL